jgi:hypothetical protein
MEAKRSQQEIFLRQRLKRLFLKTIEIAKQLQNLLFVGDIFGNKWYLPKEPVRVHRLGFRQELIAWRKLLELEVYHLSFKTVLKAKIPISGSSGQFAGKKMTDANPRTVIKGVSK